MSKPPPYNVDYQPDGSNCYPQNQSSVYPPPPQVQQGYVPPPGPTYYAPPPAYSVPPPAQSTQPYQQPQPAKVYKAGTSGGFLGAIGKDLFKGITSVTKDVDNMYSKMTHGSTTQILQSGCVVQLISKCSGRLLQIVNGPAGLTIDGNGPDNPQAFNTLWTVFREPNSVVIKLQNCNNYMAMVNGQLVLIAAANPLSAPPSTRFKVFQTEHFIVLQSLMECEQHIGVNADGFPRPGNVTSGTDKQAQFGVKLVQGNQQKH